MGLKFKKVSDFERKIQYDILVDAYSFDKKYYETCHVRWRENDDFFFDNLHIADMCGFITTLNDEAIGFINWDPRNFPEYAIIGDNCIIPKFKSKGYGKLQLQEAIKRITAQGVKTLYVSTNNDLIPAQKNYESVGFKRLDNSELTQWQIDQKGDIYYRLDWLDA